MPIIYFKNHTHVKKVGHTSVLLFGIYWWTWKTIVFNKLLKNNLLKKNCWSGPIKNVKILLFTMLYCFFKKIIRRYHHFTSVYQNSWWRDPSFLKTQKIRILKKWKNCCNYYYFAHVYQKPQSSEIQFLRYRERQIDFFVILA